MGCDFKPGDEVVCVDAVRWDRRAPKWMFWTNRAPRGYGPKVGQVITVAWVGPVFDLVTGVGVEFPDWPNVQWDASHFRKVQRRDLTAWLATEKTIEEPKRAPAKKRERV